MKLGIDKSNWKWSTTELDHYTNNIKATIKFFVSFSRHVFLFFFFFFFFLRRHTSLYNWIESWNSKSAIKLKERLQLQLAGLMICSKQCQTVSGGPTPIQGPLSPRHVIPCQLWEMILAQCCIIINRDKTHFHSYIFTWFSLWSLTFFSPLLVSILKNASRFCP